MSFDVIVIGAGHNGLVCAARLARAGRRVLVLERRDKAGGLCATDEFHPGFSAPGPLHDTRGFSTRVVEALKLKDHGLTRLADDPVRILQPDGREFTIGNDKLDGVEGTDRDAYRDWRGFVQSVGPVLRYVAERPPPPLHPQTSRDFWSLALAGIKLRKLGKQRMVELMRVTPMAAADWLNEYFPDPSISEALLGPTLLGLFMGPWSAGTAFNLLFKESLRGNAVDGGPAAVTHALLGACQSAGAEIRLGQPIRRILVNHGRVTGVRTVEGEEFEAAVVAASCDPRTAMLDLVDPAELDLKVDHQFRCLRTRGTAAKVNLAVVGEPVFNNACLTTGSLDNLERAFDAVKYDRYSKYPFLDITTLAGSTFAPEGHHVISILAGYAPYAPREGWSLEQENHLTDVILDRIAVHVPDIRDRVVAREVLMPADIEERYGVSGGQIQHVEPALDQMLSMRPTISTSRYAAPIGGLYLAGAGCHPVGGVSGLPGLLAANTILRH